MKDSRAHFLKLVAIAGALMLGWWLGSFRPQQMPMAPQTATPSTNPEAKAKKNELRVTAVPLSPSSAVMHADHYTELVRATNRGDANAAYQLARGRESCMELNGRQHIYKLANDHVQDTPLTAEERETIAREKVDQQEQINRLREACLGDQNARLEEVHDAWARAAQLGSRDAQYEYALNPRLNMLNPGSDLDRWREWRDAAPKYLDGLLQSGDPRAALTLAAASDQVDCLWTGSGQDVCGSASGLSLFLPQQETDAYKYYFLDQLLNDSEHAGWVNIELQKIEALLTPQEIASAQAQAQQMYARIRAGNTGG